MDINAGLIAIGAAIAVGLPGIGVGLGQANAVKGALEAIGRNPEAKGAINSTMYVGVALAETAAIYGVLISGALTYILFTMVN